MNRTLTRKEIDDILDGLPMPSPVLIDTLKGALVDCAMTKSITAKANLDRPLEDKEIDEICIKFNLPKPDNINTSALTNIIRAAVATKRLDKLTNTMMAIVPDSKYVQALIFLEGESSDIGLNPKPSLDELEKLAKQLGQTLKDVHAVQYILGVSRQ